MEASPKLLRRHAAPAELKTEGDKNIDDQKKTNSPDDQKLGVQTKTQSSSDIQTTGVQTKTQSSDHQTTGVQTKTQSPDDQKVGVQTKTQPPDNQTSGVQTKTQSHEEIAPLDTELKPELAPLVDCDQEGCVKVFRLERTVSQGRLGGRQSPLNSCVLIMIALCKLLIENGIRSFGYEDLKASVRHSIANAIAIGNEMYEKFVEANPKRSKTLFSIPEGLSVMGNSFKSGKFVKLGQEPSGMRDSLRDTIRQFYAEWQVVKTAVDPTNTTRHDTQLLLGTILGLKAFLITVSEDYICLMDGHSDKEYGGFVAMAPFPTGLTDLCDFMVRSYPEAKTGVMTTLMHETHPRFKEKQMF